MTISDVKNVCTGCDRETEGDLVPWSGERLCWDCTDFQLDLLAKACEDQLPVEIGRRASGRITGMEVEFDLRTARRMARLPVRLALVGALNGTEDGR